MKKTWHHLSSHVGSSPCSILSGVNDKHTLHSLDPCTANCSQWTKETLHTKSTPKRQKNPKEMGSRLDKRECCKPQMLKYRTPSIVNTPSWSLQHSKPQYTQTLNPPKLQTPELFPNLPYSPPKCYFIIITRLLSSCANWIYNAEATSYTLKPFYYLVVGEHMPCLTKVNTPSPFTSPH